VDIDRQAIERRDFPIVRRGYEPAAVDAHLRALAAELEQLSRGLADGEELSLAAAASSQVQSILRAAEKAAADIERDALERASNLRGGADTDAQRTREEAIAGARAHLAEVAQAASALLQRVTTLEGEVGALLDNLRDGAGRVASDVAALDASMDELYAAAAGQAAAPGRVQRARAGAPAASAGQAQQAERAGAQGAGTERTGARDAGAERIGAQGAAAERAAQPAVPSPAPAASSQTAPAADNGDLDGARLVALNMALSGESRAATERYLAEHFQLAERQSLVDEVYAAIED
jgi:hypothetical protein